jgi:hypothetical protein
MVSIQISKAMHDYMLPIFGIAGCCKTHLHCRTDKHYGDRYYFIGSHDQYNDFVNRCKYM